MRDLGEKLLSTSRYLTRYTEMVGYRIGEYMRGTYLYEKDYPRDELYDDLIKEFCLTPLRIGDLRSVLVYVEPVRRQTVDGVRTLYVAEARVGYDGSRKLWRARPNGLAAFPYRGVVAKASAGLRAYVTSKDLTQFEQEARATLEIARDALEAFAPIVESHDRRVRHEIDLGMSGF